jgi:hypothetical protein
MKISFVTTVFSREFTFWGTKLKAQSCTETVATDELNAMIWTEEGSLLQQ